MACTARGSWTVARTRSRPPQRGQARTSRANTRRIRAAQVHAPGVPAARGAGVELAPGGAAARARRIADYGLQVGECVLPDGINSHLVEINAAVLRIKLEYLERWNVARRKRARRYSDLLGAHVRVPAEGPDAEPVYHAYVTEVPNRDQVQRAMVEDGIQARVHYPRPLHRHSLLQSHARPGQTFPVSEQLAGTVLSMPIYPEMSLDEVCIAAGALLRGLGISPHAPTRKRAD